MFMRKTFKSALICASVFGVVCVPAFAQTPSPSPSPKATGNPIAPHIYAADPSAHVWPSDPETLYLYTSVDTPGTNHHASMDSYHVFSTKDGTNWIDHGEVLAVNKVKWASSHAWAIDATYYQGKYYLIYCMKHLKDGLFATGIAVSDRPEGPFEDIGTIAGLENGQDPALFVDEDGKKYLYWGYGHHIFGAQLTEDFRAIIPASKIELTSQLEEPFEGPWMNKINGTYYLSYPGLPKRQWPQHMYYATSKSPLGPFKPRGKYMEGFDGQAGTIHGSIIKWRDKWISFYHSAWVSGGKGENRSLMADYITFNKKDGSFSKQKPSYEGIAIGGKSRTIIRLEAENGPPAGGLIRGPVVKSETPNFSGRGYVTEFANFEQLVGVSAYLAKPQKMRLKVRYATPKDTKVFIMVNEKNHNGGYEFYKDIVLTKSDSFIEADLGIVDLKEAANMITLTSTNEKGLKLDYVQLEPLD